MMLDSRRSRYSRSSYRRSLSSSSSRSSIRCCSRSCGSSDAENLGNNLYVTGLSSWVTKEELKRHFESEGKVTDVHLVVDPWTGESRGFGFVTMGSVKEADRCMKYLNQSVLEGRVITVEKQARRRRGRTPTPGRYLGVRTIRERRRSPSYSPYYRRRYRSSDRERSYSPSYYRYRPRSPLTPRYSNRHRSYVGGYGQSPASRRYYCRSYSRDTRCYSRSVSPYYRRRRNRSISHSMSPRCRGSRRSYSRSLSPRLRRSYSRSISPKRSSKRAYSRSYSPAPRSWKRSTTCSISQRRGRGYSRESYSHSRSSMSSPSRSDSRSSSCSRSRSRSARL